MFKKALAVVSAVVLAGVMFVSCGGNENKGVADNVTDPFHKYSSELTLSVGQWVADEKNFPEGQSPKDNQMYDLIKKYTNIKLDAAITVPNGTEFYNKIATAQLTDTLPDMTAMDQITFSNAVEAGQLADLTDIYEKLASPTLKRIMSYQDDLLLNLGKVDGKLYALPEISSPMDGVPVMWIRKDWIDIIGWKNSAGGVEPQTYEEFEALAYAFKTNIKKIETSTGVANCYSLGFYKDLSLPYYAIMNANGAYPEIYVEGGDKITYGSVQDNMVDGLKVLNKYDSDGLFLKGWATQPTNTIMQHCAQGRVGILIDSFYGSLSSSIKGVMGLQFNGDQGLKDAEWMAVPVKGADGKEFVPTTIIKPRNYYTVNVNYPNPEAMIIMMNYMVEEYNTDGNEENGQGRYSEFTKEFKELSHSEKLVSRTISNWLPFMMYDPEINIVYTKHICAAIEDPSKVAELDVEEKYFYELMTKETTTPAERLNQWSYQYVYGPKGGIQAYMKYDGRYVYDAYMDVPTPTMQLNSNILLNTIERTSVTTMITQLTPEQIGSKFSEMKSDWFKNGGTKILGEING